MSSVSPRGVASRLCRSRSLRRINMSYYFYCLIKAMAKCRKMEQMRQLRRHSDCALDTRVFMMMRQSRGGSMGEKRRERVGGVECKVRRTKNISKALSDQGSRGRQSTRGCCVSLSMQNRRSALAVVRVPLSASTSYSKSRPQPPPLPPTLSYCAWRVEATLEGLNFNSFAARALRILGQHLARFNVAATAPPPSAH